MATKNAMTIEIRKPIITETKIRIVGDSPLIVHAWSEKAKKEMLDTQRNTVKKTKKKPCRMPFDDFARALYWLTPMPTETITDPCNGEEREVVTEELFDKAINEGARFGFPVSSFKMAGNSAAYRKKWSKDKVSLKGVYFLSSPDGELVEIKGDKPKVREDMVKLQGKTSDLRYRPIFENWYCDLTLRIDKDFGLSTEDVVNILNAGGMSCGIGEWRIEKDGYFGQYHVEVVK